MTVSAVHHANASSLLAPSPQRKRDAVDFQAALSAAHQNLQQTRSHTEQRQTSQEQEAAASGAGKTAAEELEEYLKKTPAQHLRDAILKEMGLTEEDLAAMPPEKRQAIEETIAEKIKEKLLEHQELARTSPPSPLSAQSLLTRSMA